MEQIGFALINVKVLGEEKVVLIMKKENVCCVSKPSYATSTVKKQNVIIAHPKGIKKIGKEDVYNLEVKETHNFVANGIVVHNSIDATRYCLDLMKDIGVAPVV